MRTLLALSLTAATLASPAAAEGSMDRYGYGPAPQALSRSAPPQQDRRFLSWANKAETTSDAEVQQERQVSSYQTFQPQAPYRQPEPQRYAALVEPTPRAYSPPTYVAPPQARPEAQSPVELAGGPPERVPVQRVAAARPMPQAAAGPNGQARYYSLHREYGLTPDAIPEQQLGNTYVLIGPSTDVAPKKDSESDGEDEKPTKAF